ncbi:MAG TPA: nuclear transport factor 2 family protein [Actinocatenispora sp.]
MDDPTGFMRRYEQATNTHDVARVAALIADDASYWFTDGSHHGIDEITAAIGRTFATITDEVYRLHDLTWVAAGRDVAACRYRFTWTGAVAGRRTAGSGRGTSILIRADDGDWRVQHEHLSA